MEFRKQLNFISPSLKNFTFSTNVAIINSGYDIPENEITNSKAIDIRYDLTRRPFQGQAPFITNFILSYLNTDNGLESTVSFNVSGRKLYGIALFATPDIYEEPIPLLNFKLSKRIGENYQISFTARNLLNAENRKTQRFKFYLYCEIIISPLCFIRRQNYDFRSASFFLLFNLLTLRHEFKNI